MLPISSSGFILCIIYAFPKHIFSLHASSYVKGDPVHLFVNKVGPYNNPHETYHFYEMPVCRPKLIEYKSLTLGEVLDGDRIAKSLYDIKYLEPIKDRILCDYILSEKEIQYLKEAIEENYYFEFIIDDIPVKDFIGYFVESGIVPHTHKMYLWTHYHFNIYINMDKIIYVNTTQEHSSMILNNAEAPIRLRPTYSVSWITTDIRHENRGLLVRDNRFFPKSLEIHWLSVINSSVMVIFLMCFVVVIMSRILKNDFARYNVGEKQDGDIDEDDRGWKIIHTDVFRIPKDINLFSSILGVGTQFLMIVFGIICMALLGLFNVHRHGAVTTAAIFLYAFTSVVAGYVSASFYRMMGGRKWITNVNLTTVLFAGPFFFIWSVQNTIAWIYQSTQALPALTIILLALMWILGGYPLTILGGILGKNGKSEFNFPCRTKNIPREIPNLPWYRNSLANCFIGGFLPFSAISVEMYYIFSTLWGREPYTLYGIVGLVFFFLMTVTVCMSITLTYFQLSSEDYLWWWRSVFNAGSTSVFVFIYCTFYYFERSNMSGILQSVEFFGWSVLIAYVFFLSLGTISFIASLNFVLYIYRNIKMD